MLARSLTASLLCIVCAVPALAQHESESFAVRHLELALNIDFPRKQLFGSATVEMENWTPVSARRVSFLLGRLMEASSVRDANGAPVEFTQDVVRFADMPLRQVTQVTVTLREPVPPGRRTKVRIDYGGNLVGYAEVGWLYVKDRIDTAFTILREEALAFPAIGGTSAAANRRIPREDFSYDVSVRVPGSHVVATGGRATRVKHDDGTVTWRYVSEGRSPFLNVAIAPFDTIGVDGVHMFHLREDSAGARRLAANARQALHVLGEWFGPQRGGINVTITEIPDGWGSQAHLVGGIIQTAAAFRDSTRSNEMYHELTHLWNANDTDRPSSRWNEGLASFLEHLLFERVNGWKGRRDYQNRYLSWLRDRAAADSALRATPFTDFGKQQMTNWSYSVGFVMFATLHELVGEREFNAIVGGFYQQFVNGGGTADFVQHARRTSAIDLSSFFEDWLFTTRWTSVVAKATTIEDIKAQYVASSSSRGAPALRNER